MQSASKVLGPILIVLAARSGFAAPGDFTAYPDHAQVRTGLPATTGGTPGGAYCGPASASDIVNWLDDNGYPELLFDDTNAGTITLEIFGLGLYLSTDPDDGTTPENFVAGLQDMFDDRGLGALFDVGYLGRNMGSQTEQTLGHSFGALGLALLFGDYVIARVGWYETSGERCGGHYVAVSGYDYADGDFTVRFRDPADGVTGVATKSIVDGYYDLEDPDGIFNQYASSWSWARSPSTSCHNLSRNGYQDGFVYIVPSTFFTQVFGGGGLISYRLANGQTVSHNGAQTPATSIAIHPHQYHIYHCRPGENLIYKTDIVTNVAAPIATPAPLNQPRRLLFGSGLRLYVLQGPASGPFSILGVIEPDYHVFAQVTGAAFTAMGYWEQQDRIVVWSGATNQVQLFTPQLVPAEPPTTLPMGPAFVNPGYVAVDPASGLLYYNHNGSSSVFRYNLATHTPLAPIPSTLTDPADMAVDNHGHLFVAPTTTGPVVEFDANGMLVSDSRAANLNATSRLAMTRAVRRPLVNDYAAGRRDNDPPLDLGDLDHDLDVDSADFAAFENCFSGSGTPYPSGCDRADFDFDLDVDCDDHDAFRAAWTASGAAPVRWDCRGTTDGVPVAASRVRLENPYPNPFNPLTTVAFDLPQTAHVTIVVRDVSGRHVKTLVDEVRSAGRHTVLWNARNEQGREVAAGIYTVQLRAQGRTEMRKIVLLK